MWQSKNHGPPHGTESESETGKQTNHEDESIIVFTSTHFNWDI